MSTITKERAQEIFLGNGPEPTASEERELARIALASLEAGGKLSNFVASQESLGGDFEKVLAENIEELYVPGNSVQPAPVSVTEYPDVLPCPVMLEPGLRFGKGVPTRTMLGALQRRAEYYAELEAMTPEQRAEHDAGMKEFAAMLQGAENAGSPTTMKTAPALDSSPKIAESTSGNSPVIPDGWVMVPVELTGAMTNAMTDAILDDLHNVDVWRSVLAAAPQQEVKP